MGAIRVFEMAAVTPPIDQSIKKSLTPSIVLGFDIGVMQDIF